MLEELQSLSEAKKKQVIIIATIIIMIIVIGAWAAYFNSVIQGTAEQVADQASSTTQAAAPSVAAAPTPAPAQASGPSLWQNIENFFKGSSNYTIQPQ
jgi:flagellar basal body-associated protein FliL